LSISQESGSVARPLLDASTAQVSADPTGLAPGLYYGQITVTGGDAGGAASVTVVLNVATAGSGPGPQVQPAGLIFAGTKGAAPGSQNLLVSNATTTPVVYNSAHLTLDGGDWLQYLPNNSSVASGQPQPVVVEPAFAPLAGGVHQGSITFLFADGSISVTPVDSVVAGPGCIPARLIMLPTSVGQVFAAKQYLPQSVEVRIVDDCGVALTADRLGAEVTASFSNGDRTIRLVPTGNGYWSNSWVPLNRADGPVHVALTASLPQVSAVTAVLESDLAGSVSVPQAIAVVNAASLAADAPVAPGSLVAIAGSGLAGGTPQIGGEPLVVVNAGGSQMLAQLPSDIPVNAELQVVVQRGTAISVPIAVVIAAAAPAVFTRDGSGKGAGVIADAVSGTTNSATSPAHAGDTVAISCTGLGDPGNPVSVSIAGQDAQVVSVGAAAGMPGVYQISVVVPDGVSGGALPVVVTAAGQTSPMVTMAIQ
jgi:uncharacterized protein (TIGR03437 family)